MKKFLVLLVAMTSLLCSCGGNDNGSDNSQTTTNSQRSMDSQMPIEPVIIDEDSEINLSTLSREKVGYGQGTQLNNDNKPTGALDFNEKYGIYNAYAIGKDEKTITLTFDQGYENGYTEKILDTLKEKEVTAVFFVLQDYAEKNPELIKRMIDEGHTVGNHSVSHKSMPQLSQVECENEIRQLHDYMSENYNYEMSLFRPPMGEFSEFSLAVTSNCGYETMLWSYAYEDWNVDNQPEPKASLEKLTNALHDGAIYLLHSVSSTNAEILGDFIDNAENTGYVFK